MDQLQTKVEAINREKVELPKQLEESRGKLRNFRSGLRKNQLLMMILSKKSQILRILRM